jgi:hypothetical protein
MKITEQQFFDYISCPLKYDMKYNKGIVIDDKFSVNNILIKVTNYFYMYVINNLKTPSMNQLTTKFESLIKPYMNIISNKQYTDALFLLRNFYNWACSNKIAVIDSDVKYLFSHNGNIIEGVLNPIAINKDKNLEFLIMNFSNRVPDQLEIDTKLKYSLDMLAFNSSNKDKKIYASKIHCVKQNKDFTTTRNENDYSRLLSTIDNVCKGIENNIYFPHETHMCQQCQYRNLCRGWK